jgi:thiol-disulfide isomerase/thioredoxin
MADFNKHVPFLEANDFENGKLKINKIENQFKTTVDPSRVRPKNYIVICFVKAKWCGHCVHFMPEYAEFAKSMEEKLNMEDRVIRCVSVEQTDTDSMNAFSQQIKEIRGFPTIVAFNSDGVCIDKEHKGQRNFDALNKYANQCVIEGYKEPVKRK